MRRQKRDANKDVEGVGEWGRVIPRPSRLVGLGSVKSYPSWVRSRALAENSFNAFSARQNAPQYIVLQQTAKLAFQARYMIRQIPESVRQYATLRYFVNTREDRGMRSSPSGSPLPVVYWRQERLIVTTLSRQKFECKEVDPYIWKQPSCRPTHFAS